MKYFPNFNGNKLPFFGTYICELCELCSKLRNIYTRSNVHGGIALLKVKRNIDELFRIVREFKLFKMLSCAWILPEWVHHYTPSSDPVLVEMLRCTKFGKNYLLISMSVMIIQNVNPLWGGKRKIGLILLISQPDTNIGICRVWAKLEELLSFN